MLEFEEQFYSENIIYIAGTDEAGRGPLAGPVVAAAVVLPKDFHCELINDSKKLTEKKREEAYKIIQDNALAIGISFVDAETIDRINIYEASRLAMQNALNDMKFKYDLVLTDAMPFKTWPTKVIPIIKGDAKCECIAAASIIAKVSRDHYMYELAKKYPKYGFEKHKGYGTKLHMEALEKYGPIKGVHRETYGPVKSRQLKLF